MGVEHISMFVTSLYNEGSFWWGSSYPGWVRLAGGTREKSLERPEWLEKDKTPGRRRTNKEHLIVSTSEGQGSSLTLNPICTGWTDSSYNRGWTKICMSWVTPVQRSPHKSWVRSSACKDNNVHTLLSNDKVFRTYVTRWIQFQISSPTEIQDTVTSSQGKR